MYGSDVASGVPPRRGGIDRSFFIHAPFDAWNAAPVVDVQSPIVHVDLRIDAPAVRGV